MVSKNNKFHTILASLSETKGLHKPVVLSKSKINEIKKLNSEENVGVKRVLLKKHVILVFHDSKFRKPRSKIVLKSKNKTIFPVVHFPEIKNAISSSPDLKVHKYLTKSIKTKKDWASLLIGFN